MPSTVLFKPSIPTPVTPAAEVIAALGADLSALKSNLSETGKINLIRIQDVAAGEAEKIDYRAYNQWLIYTPADASGELGVIYGRSVKWMLEKNDLVNYEVNLNETLADAQKLHGVLIQIDAYLERYEHEQSFQEDVRSGKQTYLSTNFRDSEFRIAMNHYKTKHQQLEETKVLLANYFTKLLEASNYTLPEKGITYLHFNSSWKQQDKLRNESMKSIHKLAADSVGIKPAVQVTSPPATFSLG